MKKIAFIVQRYGLELNGGSELYTREVAEHLSEEYDVHVITTCALDHITWANYYKSGVEKINNVTVHRFSTECQRYKNWGAIAEKLFLNKDSIELQNEWIDAQGPMSADAIKYICDSIDEYDVFIFVTYLYYLTVRGLEKVCNKSILIPTAHDEPYIYFDIYRPVFMLPKAIIYLTHEEKSFVQNLFHNSDITSEVTGIGIDIPDNINKIDFAKRYNIQDDYIIYVGRIEQAKGCYELFNYFIEYKKRNLSGLKLVLVGKATIDIPNHKDIIKLGFISEEDKFGAILNSKALILPSKFESLSIAVLESLACKVPVIVNEKCSVLKGHCKRSNAGLYYNNFFEFEATVNYILNNPKQSLIMGNNGQKYVRKNYQWNIINNKMKKIISTVIENQK